jgi:hypothetical protein
MAKKYWYLRILFGLLLIVLVYIALHKDDIIQEHLANGPPTLLSLQKDTKELDKRVTTLKKDFDKMSAQAKQGADAAAAARAQVSALKYSPASTSPPGNIKIGG